MDALIYNKIETEAQRIIDAVASGGTAIKIGEDVVASGENKYSLRVNLPSNWSEEYDVIIGLNAVSCSDSDWIYAPFSNTAAAGSFINYTANTLCLTPLVVCSNNDTLYYKGVANTASEITTHETDFLMIRLYTTTRNFSEGSYLSVYGFKRNN